MRLSSIITNPLKFKTGDISFGKKKKTPKLVVTEPYYDKVDISPKGYRQQIRAGIEADYMGLFSGNATSETVKNAKIAIIAKVLKDDLKLDIKNPNQTIVMITNDDREQNLSKFPEALFDPGIVKNVVRQQFIATQEGLFFSDVGIQEISDFNQKLSGQENQTAEVEKKADLLYRKISGKIYRLDGTYPSLKEIKAKKQEINNKVKQKIKACEKAKAEKGQSQKKSSTVQNIRSLQEMRTHWESTEDPSGSDNGEKERQAAISDFMKGMQNRWVRQKEQTKQAKNTGNQKEDSSVVDPVEEQRQATISDFLKGMKDRWESKKDPVKEERQAAIRDLADREKARLNEQAKNTGN